MRSRKASPLSVVDFADERGVSANGHRVGIWEYENIYDCIGVGQETFSKWQDRYGMDSLGVGEGGILLAPGFPMFSKIAWMYVDPVILSPSETKQLLNEIETLLNRVGNSDTRKELEGIREVATMAIAREAPLRIGPP